MAIYECNGCGVACCEINISTDDREPEDVCSEAKCPLNNDLVDFRLQDSIRYGCHDDGTHRAICRHCRHNPNARDSSKPNSCDLSGTMKTWSDTCENWKDCKPTDEELAQFHEEIDERNKKADENKCGTCGWHAHEEGWCEAPGNTFKKKASTDSCDCGYWEKEGV